MGRALLESDEVPGAPEVVVLSYDVWQSRMGGDPEVLGTSIRIGTTAHTTLSAVINAKTPNSASENTRASSKKPSNFD